jgi:hypothetical protein
MKKNQMNIEYVVSTVVNILRELNVTFKNVTDFAFTEGDEFLPADEKVDADELIYDEQEDEKYNCQLAFSPDRSGDVLRELTKTFGEPAARSGSEPQLFWKFGRKSNGAIYAYDDRNGQSVVDVSYYYTKG